MSSIVIVDDRVTNRHILTRLALLVEEGVSVAAFESPLEALNALETGLQPDLIITDFNMPGMDGASFIRELRARDSFADIPIIVVTIYEDLEYRYRALEAGATDFLLSPVDNVEFRARARNLLALRRQQRLLLERTEGLEHALKYARSGADVEHGLAALLDAMPVAFAALDIEGRIELMNRAHEELFAVDRARAVGRLAVEVYGEELAARHGVHGSKAIEIGVPGRPRMEYATLADGSRQLAFLSAARLDPAGVGCGSVTVALDVSDLDRPQRTDMGALIRDPITELPGVELFRERAGQEMARARRQGEMLALFRVDLDRFKGINDAFGIHFGNQLLRGVGRRLRSRLRDSDLVARLDSDDFIILQTGIERSDDASELCRRLADVFAAPFLIGRQEVHLSASMGVTIYPADAKALDALLKNAELAMYRAKAAGRDTYRFFAAEMNYAARRAVTLERELRQALAGEQFAVHYQPQLALVPRRIIGVEALVRWHHPQRGVVRPAEFIALAEDIGLIAPLTAWVLQTACRQLRAWQDRGLNGLQLSVNLSPVQFRERGVELLVERVLKDSGVAPSDLDIELTENAVIENSQTATASLRYLHQLGVSLSIDDFGTGYSSLSYVKRLPVQRLKIDQSFIHNLAHSTNDEVIVRAIINLGHSLGLRVIAEGVETEEQLRRLQQYGSDEVQGHLISPPLAAADIEKLLLERDRDAHPALGIAHR